MKVFFVHVELMMYCLLSVHFCQITSNMITKHCTPLKSPILRAFCVKLLRNCTKLTDDVKKIFAKRWTQQLCMKKLRSNLSKVYVCFFNCVDSMLSGKDYSYSAVKKWGKSYPNPTGPMWKK